MNSIDEGSFLWLNTLFTEKATIAIATIIPKKIHNLYIK